MGTTGQGLCMRLLCAALCLGIVAPCCPPPSSSSYLLSLLSSPFSQPQHDDKTWLFAISGRRKPYQFVNDLGEVEGFNINLINEVCQVAHRKCDIVLQEFTECTYTYRDVNYPGRGLMAGWFDACPGYAISVDRQATFDFTLPFVTSTGRFAVLPGNPSGFNPDTDDYSGFTFTHLTGAATNAACLRRLGKTFGNIIVAANLPEAKELLANGTAQVIFAPRSSIPDLDVFSQEITCTRGGAGMMVKKGSKLPEWWNPAFRYYKASGRFHALCRRDSVKYNRTINCVA